MRRSLRTVAVLALLGAFQLLAGLLLGALVWLLVALAVHRGTWVPTFGMIKLAGFTVLLAVGLFRVGASEDAPQEAAAGPPDRGCGTPPAPLLLRSRARFTAILAATPPPDQGIAAATASALRRCHARVFLRATRAMAAELENQAAGS
ncbi:hypothetical protein [Streptacidiphilus rugosus]|uniref:hypothetical protein n=1 Tax=Streptacidiphilus rugosus TaxID=405783 RepID=UPI00055CDCC2|nr:hypothetical protein [Streptacidiphilus rugosus]